MDKQRLIHRLLEVVEKDIVPLTQEGVRQGNKIFGAAILQKADLSLVVAAINQVTKSPLWHGEVYALKKFYEIPQAQRPLPQDCIFLATHEPCSLCLSAITWGGYNNFYYLFNYYDTRDEFNVPHDLKILEEVFKCDKGQYARENYYWHSYNLLNLINACEAEEKKNFIERVKRLKQIYIEMAKIYERFKGDNDPFG